MYKDPSLLIARTLEIIHRIFTKCCFMRMLRDKRGLILITLNVLRGPKRSHMQLEYGDRAERTRVEACPKQGKLTRVDRADVAWLNVQCSLCSKRVPSL